VHSALVFAEKSALKIIQSSKGGRMTYSRYKASKLSTVLVFEENKFLITQPKMPVFALGAGLDCLKKLMLNALKRRLVGRISVKKWVYLCMAYIP
jgi:hypothetical protein